MAILTSVYDLPPLPEYHLTPLPPLVAPIPDKLFTLLLPIAAYWGLSMFFHWIDVKDYFSKYRLHTPAEVLKRNHVSRWEVVRDVLIQQVVQTVVGTLLGMTEPDDFFGKEEYDVAVWARRIRIMQRVLPGLLSLVSVNANELAKNIAGSYPTVAGAISGGLYPSLTQMVQITDGHETMIANFATWEIYAAKAMYWYIVPALQFGLAIFIVDTWQYFLHRAMHMNKWLYSKQTLLLCTNYILKSSSDYPFPPSSTLRSIRLWSSIQSPFGRLPLRHTWCQYCFQGRRYEHTPRHVVLHMLHVQNR